ncbi:trimethylamine methyltransferase family protein [Chloroflexota bacterium]
MEISVPYYRPLSTKHVKQIDQTGRKILERVGIRIMDSTFLDTLKKAGAQVDYESQRVRFEGSWLDEVLSQAPPRFTLYSRDDQNNLYLGEGKVYFANGGRVFRILDMSTGGYRLTMLRDVANAATLVNHLDYINFYIIACQAHDLEPENYHINDFYQAFNHTTKHVLGGCDNLEGAKQVWALASIIAGGEAKLQDKPLFSVITNPISPLSIDANTLSIINFCATHGIPLTCAPAPISTFPFVVISPSWSKKLTTFAG